MPFIQFTRTPEPKNNLGAPVTDLVRAYEPLVYEFQYSNGANPLPPRASVTILINGAAFGVAKDISPVSSAGAVYTFKLDVADRVQEFMDSENMLKDVREYELLATPSASSQNAYFQKQVNFSISIAFFISAGTGSSYISDGAANTLSGNLYAINARGNTEGVLTLLGFTAPTSATTRRYLTNAPITQGIRLKDSYYLSYWCDKAEGVTQVARIITYNSAGVATLTTYYDLSAAGTINRVRTIPIGPDDINATSSSFFIGGIAATIDATVAYYTVRVGSYNTGTAVFTPQFIELTFALDFSNCDYVRAYFLNALGGLDAINFDYNQSQDVEDVTFTQYRRNQDALIRFERRGAVQLETQRRRTILLRDNVSGGIIEWYRELSSSPLIAIEYNPNPKSSLSVRRAVVLSGSPKIIYQTTEAFVFELELEYSNINTSQNN